MANTPYYTKAETDAIEANLRRQYNYESSKYRGYLAIATVPTLDGWYWATQIGTYTNAGGLVTVANKINMIEKDGVTFRLNAIDVPVTPVVDGFASNSTTSAGSANNDKVLNEKISTLDFKRDATPNLSFQGFPTPAQFTYNSSTGVLSGTGGSFSTAQSVIELNTMVISPYQWIQIGAGTDYAIVVSTSSSLIGQVAKVNLDKTLTYGTVKFPNTAITGSFIKVDVSTTDVIISRSTDNITFTEWGRRAKNDLGFAYVNEFLGVISGGTATVYTVDIPQSFAGNTSILNATVLEKAEDGNDFFMILNSSELSGVKKLNKANFKDSITAEIGNISFKPEPAIISFISSSGGTASYNPSTGIMTSTPQSGESFTCGISAVNLKDITINFYQWICIGTTATGEGIIVSISSNSIGGVRTITSGGALTGGTTKFPTTTIPIASNRVKIDVSTADVIILYSLDAGITFTEWGRCAKSNLGFTYGETKLGTLGGGNTIIFDYTVNQDDISGYILDGSTVPLTTSLYTTDEYIALVNNKKTPGMRKITPANLLNSIGISTLWTAGKKCVLYGDSITVEHTAAGQPSVTGAYSLRILSKLKLETVSKKGGSGFSLGSGGGSTLANDIKLQEITDLTPDLIIIFAGTNDYGNAGGTVLGLPTSTIITETAGGLRYIIRWFQKRNPSAQLVYCTPTPRLTQLTNNPLGYNLNDLVKVVKEVCAMHSVPVCDLFSLSGIGYADVESTGLYLQDGLHPNDLGYERITSLQSNFIKNLR